jgi:hypothetical protein
MKFRKKPVEIEAMRIATDISAPRGILDPNTRSQAEIAGWMMGNGFYDFKVHGERAPYGVAIHTLEGIMVADPGDWIIRGVQGEFYPCKPNIFEQTYEPVEETP